MPVVLRKDGFRFFFYSNEGNPPEPAHIHVRQGGDEAKFRISPQIQLLDNNGFDAPKLRKISGIITENRKYLEDAWHEYFA